MTKATKQISVALLVSAVYLACLNNVIPVFSAKVQDEILPVLPLWAIVTFGSYLLSSIGWNLLFFNDAPEAQQSLLREIDMARKELRGKGVDVD